MYAALFWKRVTGLMSRLWQGAVMRSGMVTITVLAIILLTLAFGWREHMRGQFARLKREFNGNPPALSVQLPLPGGQEPVVLERSTIEGGSVPEFLSTTLLPGRGMTMFQIKAHIPGKGEVGLLASPPLAEAAALMTGNGADANGSESLAVGGAFEIPWAGRVFGTPSENGLNTAWEGRNICLPADRSDRGKVAKGGLVLRSPFSSVKINAMPDGGEAEAVYEAGNFDGRWPSKLQITSTTQLSSRVLEMKVTARNTGDEPAPVGIGWLPRFAILDGGRGELILRLPSVTRVEQSTQHPGAPTGKLKTVAGTKYDFSGRSGAKLDGVILDDTFVNLRQAPLDNGPVAELRDPVNGYGLRITILSPSINALYVFTPREEGYVTISPRFNYDDPFGREWNNEDTGMAIVRPGQTAQWKIRLEIFAVPSTGY